jgi:hypothetical protein
MPINEDYKMGLKREIVSALRPIFGDTYPDEDLRNRVKVGFEYPRTEVMYPAIYLMYAEGPIENMGVGHYHLSTDEHGNPQKYKHYRFQGRLDFNAVALSPIERDKLAAGIVNILALGDEMPEFESFHKEIHDSDWLQIHLLTDIITPGGEQIYDTPWGNPDERVYGNSYSVNVYGEFFSDAVSGDLIQINQIVLFPYLEGELPPF